MKSAVAFALVAGLGCGGGQLPGTDPATTTIGVDGEGLPLVAALPPTSGSCTGTISGSPSRVVETASWDAVTRTFMMGALTWKLDEHGRIVEYGQTGGEWRHLMTRDEHGVLTGFTYEWNGAPYATNSWDQRNNYDANGRLIGSVLVYRSGLRQATYTYQYDDQNRLTNVTVVSQDGDQTVQNWTKLYWSNWGSDNTWKLITRQRGSGSTMRGNDTRYYHDSGRLGSIDIDGGGIAPAVDGLIDMRRTWSYDDAGRLVRHEYDGTEALDAPVIDGVPDGVVTFDTSCAAIAVLPRELYLLESWVKLP
jgi:hypothetical protein